MVVEQREFDLLERRRRIIKYSPSTTITSSTKIFMKTESAYHCLNCGKVTPDGSNFCNWDCHIDLAVKDGGVKHQPNGLPIRCIKFDNSLWEHEHGDHPDYIFPVDIDQYSDSPFREDHALIYTDGHIAVTVYECQYFMWSLYTRKNMNGNGSTLSKESHKKILEYVEKENVKKTKLL